MQRNERLSSSRSSFRVNSRRRFRNASILRRRPPKVTCRCFAGQIHIKSFLVGIQVLFLAAGCAGLVFTSTPFDTTFFIRVTPNGTVYDGRGFYRNLISTYSLYLILSVVSCAIGLHLIRKIGINERIEEGKRKILICNPSLLLLPLLLSEMILLVFFTVWASSTLRIQTVEFSTNGATFMSFMDMLRFAVVPVVIGWILLCYIIYNTFVCYAFIWRQSSRSVRFSQSLFSHQSEEEEPTMNCSIQDFPPPAPTAFVKRSPTSPWRKSQKLNSLDTAHARKLRNLKDLNVSLESVDETEDVSPTKSVKLLSPNKSSGRLNSSFSSLNILPTLHENPEKEPLPSPETRNKNHQETVELRRLDTSLEENKNGNRVC